VAYIYGHKFAKNALKFQPLGYDDDDDDGGGGGGDPIVIFDNTGGPPYPRVIRSKTYRSYVKPQITPNAIYNVIFV
jgi:hypothetical protein